jgi:hypothetical protein
VLLIALAVNGQILKGAGIHSLKQLKSIATVQSVGASTRIEGFKLTNDEVQVLLFENLKIDKLADRDQPTKS